MKKPLNKNVTQHRVYSTLPICSFTLTAKIPKKLQPILKPTTLGEHIRKVRLKREELQQDVAKLLGINSVYLSSWEHKRKAPHPKYLDPIINYLGYIPRIISKIDFLGTRVKLYRKKYKLSIETFCQLGSIDVDVIMKLENARFCKIDKETKKVIEIQLKKAPTSFCEEIA
ncbi:MAG: helix-turn-helix transcriptional regulator [Flavobacteriaceae bacterium]